ncbi:hypothetical protein [Pseudothioclava arenosa]|uniref:Lipoprotein n=1 Tax=Pseudothioclava arenosa TaxID=1795308 RepID=A0A2A4CP30_9RHOB|nr:hypothetical protein [Pseudothioclava arenosa]PCD76375.1 hypothetical protein CLN94_09310 [Pseudothioclava arenosa]
MRRFAPLFACLALGACIDADVTLDFSDGETVQTTAELSLSRQLYDMMGKKAENACPGGESSLTKSAYHCTMHDQREIAVVLDEGGKVSGKSELDPTEAASIERIDDNHLRVSFDFTEMLKSNGQKPDDLGGMEDMVRAAMAGHSLSFNVTGYKITSSTGVISEDGKTASRVIPVIALLDQAPELGEPFVTEVQLAQSCFLWVFCD